MDFLLQKKEFDWILKVLESCCNESQIRTTENLYKNFIKKWEYDFSSEKIKILDNSFQNWKTKKFRKLLIDLR